VPGLTARRAARLEGVEVPLLVTNDADASRDVWPVSVADSGGPAPDPRVHPDARPRARARTRGDSPALHPCRTLVHGEQASLAYRTSVLTLEHWEIWPV